MFAAQTSETTMMTFYICLTCRWREDQLNMTATHVATSLRSRPASVDVLAKTVQEEYGMLDLLVDNFRCSDIHDVHNC